MVQAEADLDGRAAPAAEGSSTRRAEPRPRAPRAAKARPLAWLVPAVVTGALAPLPIMALRFYRGTLGANPIAEALNQLGLLALVLLLASLACTPLKILSGWTWPIRIRKTLGLIGFTYASIHVLTYSVLDQALAWAAIVDDILERNFIAVGLLAFLLLVPLAVTSTSGMLKRLGFARWKRLHRLAYVAAGLGVVHFFWRVKKDLSEPLTYGVILGALLAVRLLDYLRTRGAPARKGAQ
jgi:sulfoxide reductase heme-binding subunit YedZ